ncbi:MAG: CsgG/HfaB family protein [bacterium]|nr:CsgG/HfaB family protein [bacterium]
MKRKMAPVGISLLLAALLTGCAAKSAGPTTGSLLGGSTAATPTVQTQPVYSSVPAPKGPKLTISVMDMNVTSGLSPQEVSMLTDKLLNEFVNTKFYKVVERSKRDEILKEQGFQQSGACDQGACLVEAGQLLGVQKMVGGTIGKLGVMYVVELRIMDVKTGEIDQAFSRKYSGDVSNLLDAMREAAVVFSGGTAVPAQANPAGQSQPLKRRK